MKIADAIVTIDVRPLPYTGAVTDDQREALIAGKQLLGVDFFVRPEVAKPGVDGRVLAFEWPGFYIEDGFALLTKEATPERMAAALKEVLGITDGRYLIRPEQWLDRYLGPGVRFVELEEDE